MRNNVTALSLPKQSTWSEFYFSELFFQELILAGNVSFYLCDYVPHRPVVCRCLELTVGIRMWEFGATWWHKKRKTMDFPFRITVSVENGTNWGWLWSAKGSSPHNELYFITYFKYIEYLYNHKHKDYTLDMYGDQDPLSLFTLYWESHRRTAMWEYNDRGH